MGYGIWDMGEVSVENTGNSGTSNEDISGFSSVKERGNGFSSDMASNCS